MGGSLIKKSKKFYNLSFKEKKTFFEAYFLVGIMRAAILGVSFKRLTRSLEHQKSALNISPLDCKETQTALSVGKAIRMASANTPWESTCLAQSLAARMMLQRRGIPGVFFLGVAKNEEGVEKMKAHSWSQCGDVIVTGGDGYEDFTVLSIFGWAKK